MLDVHNHILYGVDDGPAKLEESLSILSGMYELGFDSFIFTPHWMPGRFTASAEEVGFSARKLIDTALNAGINVKYTTGRECYFSFELMELAESVPLYFSWYNAKYILIELPVFTEPRNCKELAENFTSRGIRPILAHAERYIYLQSEPQRIEQYREWGYLIQCDLAPLCTPESTQYNIETEWLEMGAIDLFASDLHRPAGVETIAYAMEELKTLVGTDRYLNYFSLP